MRQSVRSRRSREMSEILDWGESKGLTLRKTADEAGVPLSTLRYWQKRLREGGTDSGPADQLSAFVPVTVVAPEVPREQADVVVEVGAEFRVRIGAGFDAELLGRLLEVLRRC